MGSPGDLGSNPGDNTIFLNCIGTGGWLQMVAIAFGCAIKNPTLLKMGYIMCRVINS